jgi:hypothetical protein
MAYKQLEDKYLLTDFKRDEKDFVKGRMGPHDVVVDQYLDIFVMGNANNDSKRKWVANLMPGGFFFSIAEEKKKSFVFQVLMMENKPYLIKEHFVDERLFARAAGNMEEGDFLSLDGAKKALEFCRKGKLELAEYGNEKLAKQRLKNLRGVVEYEEDIKEAAQVFLQQDRIREHAEVIKLRKEKGEIEPLNEEKAEMLAAIGFIEQSGGKAIKPVILKFLKERSGLDGNRAGIEDIMKVSVLLKELEEQGYVKPVEGKGYILTDMGRAEVENYNRKKSSYAV